MKARLTKDAVTGASTLIIACLLIASTGLAADLASKQPPHVEPNLSVGSQNSNLPNDLSDQFAAAAVEAPRRAPGPGRATQPFLLSGWTFVTVGLLLGLASGVIATMLVLQRQARPGRDDALETDVDASPQHSANAASPVVARLGSAWDAFRNWTVRPPSMVRRILRRMIPSRQFVVRALCLLAGTALMLVSLFGFSRGAVLVSFLGLSAGYALAVCAWLLPFRATGAATDSAQPDALRTRARPSRAAVVRPDFACRPSQQHDDATTRPTGPPVAPQPASHLAPARQSLPVGRSTLLICRPCGKQFSVRGEGEVGLRLIPCPECNSALAMIGDHGIHSPTIEPDFPPIVSVACKQCRAIIDVPYGSIGGSIACPRCRAELPVPRLDHEPRLLPHRQHLVRS